MSASGANTAERGPTHTRASPERSRSHSSWRSPWPSPEWSTATTSPNRAWNRPTVCGVSAISGTSTIAPRPAASVASTARRYTSVLPEPVTPWSRNRPSRRARAPQEPRRAPRLLDGQRRRAVEPPSDRHRRRAARAGHARAARTRPRPSSRRSVGVPSAPPPSGRRAGAPRARPAGGRSGGAPRQRLRARVGQLGHQHALAPHAGGGSGRQHERERPRRRRAVLARRSTPPARPGRPARPAGRRGSAHSRSGATALASASSTTTPSARGARTGRAAASRRRRRASAPGRRSRTARAPHARGERLDAGDRGHRRRLEREAVGSTVLRRCGVCLLCWFVPR